jgi:hypothetical protein
MSQASWFSIRRRTAIAAAAIGIAAAASAEVFIYGDIGESWWGETVAARTFVAELAALDVDQMCRMAWPSTTRSSATRPR